MSMFFILLLEGGRGIGGPRISLKKICASFKGEENLFKQLLHQEQISSAVLVGSCSDKL